MKILFLFSLSLIFFSEKVYSTNGDRIVLISFNGSGQEIERTTLEINLANVCVMETKKALPSKSISRLLSSSDCNEVSTELKAVSKEVSRNAVSTQKPDHLLLSDEPNYAFEYHGLRFYVPLQSPSECDMTPSGKLYPCRYNDLSAAQTLLLSVRAAKSKKN